MSELLSARFLCPLFILLLDSEYLVKAKPSTISLSIKDNDVETCVTPSNYPQPTQRALVALKAHQAQCAPTHTACVTTCYGVPSMWSDAESVVALASWFFFMTAAQLDHM